MMKEPSIDFIVTDYLQRLETFAVAGRVLGADARASLATAELYAAAVLVPVCGEAVQKNGTEGFDPDGFMLQHSQVAFLTLGDVERVTLIGWLPTQHVAPVEVRVGYQDARACSSAAPGNQFMVELAAAIPGGSEGRLSIELSSSFQPSNLPGGSADTRRLGCIMQSIRFS
jgi:hypothetical protein